MNLVLRTIRSSLLFGRIFVSYLVQYTLDRLFERWEKDANGREAQELPRWVARRAERTHEINAKRLLNGMIELRGVYIKLGQILSIMGGFLPRAFTKELERLQDSVPPQPYDEIARAVFESTGKLPHELFDSFAHEPLAAASLGQVHVAEYAGQKLAVKVLYPGIREVIAADMKVVAAAIRVYNFFVPVYGLSRAHAELVDLLHRETNYLHEARCMERFAVNFADEKDIIVPQVIWSKTSNDVLCMSFVEGIKINRIDEIRAAGIDPSAVAVRFTESFYKQLFLHRFFHADPHPGNFLVQAGRTARRPKIVVLDFGAMSEVQPHMIDGLIDVIGGMVEGDESRLLTGFFAMGFVSKEANHELLRKTVSRYFEKLLRIQDRTPAALMRANQKELEALVDPGVARDELRELMKSMEYPEGWFYVERASVMAFWLLSQIDPELDAMQVGYPYIKPLLQGRVQLSIPQAVQLSQ